MVGLLLGLPSRRLLGDYLAIVTLFFGQAFVTFVTNGNRLTLLGHSRAVDLTSGPNGISDLDPLNFFGQKVRLDPGVLLRLADHARVVVIVLHFAVESRTGRAWKALREDPLAAELMSIPVNRLKLLAFAFGAGIAGLTGAISAAVDGAVFPDSYDIAAPDHGLRDGDPRRRREPERRRSSARSRSTSRSRCCATRTRRAGSSTR